MRYADIMGRIENLRVVDQGKLMSFSQYLKGCDGPSPFAPKYKKMLS